MYNRVHCRMREQRVPHSFVADIGFSIWGSTWMASHGVAVHQGTSRLLHSHEGAPLVDVASTVGEQPIDESAGFPFVQGDWHTVGYIFGIVSACFYLFSRIPQIVKNVSNLTCEDIL